MRRSVVFLSLVLFLLINTLPSLAKPRLANPNCNESCVDSNVTIPFPFGIGPTCFLDEWYEIDCPNGGSTPFLKKIGLEVLNISLPEDNYPLSTDGSIEVRFPVVTNGSCAGHGGDHPPSLEGSNFFFSPMSNMFNVVGCNVLALMNSSMSAVSGCKTGCGAGKFSWNGSCPIGNSCCRTSLPSNLQEFKVEFRDVSGGDCSYAFLADQSFLVSNYSDLDPIGAGHGYVPVVLEWGISNHTEPLSQLDKPNENRYCQIESFSSYGRTMPFIQCVCYSGYEGNGYMLNSCEDIDECVSLPYYREQQLCPNNQKCANTPGSYHCVDRWKTVKFTLIGIGSALGALLLLFCAWRPRYIKKRKEIKLRKKHFKQNGGLLLQQQLNSPDGCLEKSRIFTSKDLQVATDNFSQSTVLGHGGQGTVYKGMLADGRIVAIKKSLVVDEEKPEQFINEVKQEGTEEEISRVARLAKRCLHLHGRNRPTMREVAAELEEIRNIQFPSGILKGQEKNGIMEEHTAGLAPGRSFAETMTFTSQDELPLMVMASC
ncbi:hypothetical protein MLD38_020070 [Melastoma candidum]|uniref:Uncharacterized protein n=1 Tax=Melastoma candidum TaxID=119954 RepID=A0ACB9QER2_9MYRT|nr:hypothetical protein MLD38_020070 [Melastoma candidum]